MSAPSSDAGQVVVVGGGIAGMVAATRMGQQGVRAIVLERSPEERYPCNSRITAGVFHCALTSVTTAPEELARRIDEATDGQADAQQKAAVAADALRAVRWLQELGTRFIRGTEPYHDFTLAPPTVDPQNNGWMGRGGDVLLRTLEARLVRDRGSVLRGHRAMRLTMRDGRCAGVSGERSDGTPFELPAQAVVIADGGFQADPEALRGPITPAPERVFQRNARTGIGDGLRMAREVGAATSGLSGFYGHVLSADAFRNDRLWPHLWLDFVAAAGLLCDRSGRRFADEGMGGVGMANRIAAQPDPLGTFAIADEAIWEDRGRFNMQAPNPRLRDLGGTVHAAASVRALALQAGIDPDGLERTVEEHNAAIEAGRLGALVPARTTARFAAHPIRRAPFLAIPVCAGITYTMGGVMIDGHGRVLDAGREVIGGLYAAGAATGGLEGGGRRVGYVGGLVKSTVTGLRVAESIAATLRRTS